MKPSRGHLLSMAGIFILALTASAQAQDITSERFQITIPKSYLESNCATLETQPIAVVDTVGASQYALARLRGSVCRMHANYATPQQSAAEMKRSIQDLENAQDRNLSVGLKNYALFLEGLAQCRVASSSKTRNLHDPEFCASRQAALISFQSTSWDSFVVKYPEEYASRNYWEAQLTEMQACYSDVLDSQYDGNCGVVATIGDLDALVEQVSKEAFKEKFTDAASAMDAISKRKITAANSVLGRVAAQTKENDPTNLRGKSTDLEAKATALENAAVSIQSTLDELKSLYQSIILAADEIMGEYDLLIDSFFKEGTTDWGQNLKATLDLFKRQMEDALKKPSPEQTSTWELTARFPTDFKTMLGAEGGRGQTLKRMCRIYFCEILHADNITATGPTVTSCTRSTDPAVKNNPLCIRKDGKLRNPTLKWTEALADGGSVEVDMLSICKNAGFSSAYLPSAAGVPAAMTDATRSACFNN